MQPLCSKYRWESMWPFKKYLWILFERLSSDFFVCAKAFAMDAVILAMLVLVVQHAHWLDHLYRTSYNWLGMVDFRNIPEFLEKRNLGDTEYSLWSRLHQYNHNKEEENPEINNTFTLGYMGLYFFFSIWQLWPILKRTGWIWCKINWIVVSTCST